jgi:anhydro-N-acetylmuramic acid kinase
MTERPTLAVGLMSGTSLDGMDAALVRLEGPTHATLLEFFTRPYTNEERAQIRGAFDGATASTLARLHVQVAEWAAEAVQTVLVRGSVPASELSLIAFPGQTIWHEPPVVSWQ